MSNYMYMPLNDGGKKKKNHVMNSLFLWFRVLPAKTNNTFKTDRQNENTKKDVL